ncbi:MAG: hypothetical protein WBW81_02045 [Methylocella sp.]
MLAEAASWPLQAYWAAWPAYTKALQDAGVMVAALLGARSASPPADEAAMAYSRAIELCEDEAMREFLARKAAGATPKMEGQSKTDE